MNNTDFSKLLLSDDKALVKQLTSAPKKPKRPMPEKAKGKGKGKDQGKKGKDGKGGQAPEESKYRDRALERKEGKNEYEKVAAEWESHQEQDLKESKYLGGDVEHTHLVKGLDFALLNKVRGELNKQTAKEQAMEERQAKKLPKKRTFETVLAKKIWHTAVETLHPHHKTFSQRLKGMGKAITQGQRIRGAPQVFLPGRMEYEFDVGEEQRGPSDIPRIMYISKDDAPNPDLKTRVASILQESVAKVRACILRAAEERKQRKLQKASGEKASSTVAQKVVVPVKKILAKDPDDDIFSGAGGFNGAEMIAKEAKKRQEAKAKAEGKNADGKKAETPKKSFFDDAGDQKYLKGLDDVQLEMDDVTVEEKATAGTGNGDEDESNFKASKKWRGARPGWVFKTGPQGLGYYVDDAKVVAREEAKKADVAKLGGHAEKQSLRGAKKAEADKKRPIVDDDAYGELFPSAMMGGAMVKTGEDGSDEEDDESAKKKIEKLKKLAEKDAAKGKGGGKGGDSLEKSSYGKKDKDQGDSKKRKGMSEGQQWEKIEKMMKKGKTSVEDLESSNKKHSQRNAPVPQALR